MEKEGIKVYSLTYNTLGVKMACESFEMGIKMNDKQVNYSYGPAQTKQQVAYCIIKTILVHHGHTWIHKIHHSPDLGEATTFPLIVFSMTSLRGYTQMSFFLRLPSWDSQKFRN
jgi:hypothetical protein